MIRRALVVGAALLAAAPAAAQDSAAVASRVDSIFAPMDGIDRPGCALGVHRDGRTQYARGYGMASLELAAPITPRTVFYVGSVSKQFTAMAIALLARDGRLSLDDDVRKHVPEMPAFGDPITVRHLVHHMSGLREKWDLLEIQGSRSGDVVTQDDVLDLVRAQRALNFRPGTEHLYNNTGYDLLAVIVERVSGKPLGEFARERIFEPLRMHDTRYGDDRGLIIERRAAGHAPRRGGGWRLLPVSSVETVGSGGVYSTVEDLGRWIESFHSAALGDSALIHLVTTPGVLAGGDTLQYAFGLTVDEYRGVRRIRHGGALGGYRAAVMRFPSERLGIAILCNHSTAAPEGLAARVANVLLAARLAPLARRERAAGGKTPDSATVSRVAGVYWDANREAIVRLAPVEGALALRRGGPDLPLLEVGPNRFAAPGGEPEVVFDAGDRRSPPRITIGGRRFTRVDDRAADRPAEYTGRYTSDELGVAWSIERSGDSLLVSGPRGVRFGLRRTSGDLYLTSSGSTLRFLREGGRVTGLALTPGRSRRVEFRRSR